MASSEKRPRSGVTVRLIDVVLVERDADACELISFYLRAHQCAVRTASNVDDALALIRASVPDVVVSDLDFGPGLTGWALAKTLRSDEKIRHVRRVVVTESRAEPRELLRVFDACLRKPIDLTELLDVLHEVTEITRSHRLRTVC